MLSRAIHVFFAAFSSCRPACRRKRFFVTFAAPQRDAKACPLLHPSYPGQKKDLLQSCCSVPGEVRRSS